MCYPKPGPRCSTHSLSKLRSAKSRLNKADPTDIDKFESAQHKVTEAQEEYFTSPAGIKKLRDKALQTGEQKYATKADKYAELRQSQIKNYKDMKEAAKVASQVKAPVASADTKKTPKKTTKTTLSDAAINRINIIEKYRNGISALDKRKAELGKFEITEPLANKKIRSVDYDYDGMQCGPDGICNEPENPYCSDAEYENLRIKEEAIDARRTLSEIYNCKEEEIPDELVEIGEKDLDLDKAESYEVETEYGYYGAEGASVNLCLSTKVAVRLNEYYDTKSKEIEQERKELDKTVTPYVRRSVKEADRKASRRNAESLEKPVFDMDAFERDLKGIE